METKNNINFGGVTLVSKNDSEVLESASRQELLGYMLLQTMLSSEILPVESIDIGYVVSETPDNQDKPLLKGAELLKQGIIKKLAILDPKSPVYNYGYPGPEYCLQKLVKFGVPHAKVVQILTPQPLDSFNTAIEFDIVADYLHSDTQKQNLLIISPQFHLLRSYITAITSLSARNMDLTKVYVKGIALPNYQTVIHSQGIQRSTRSQIALEEIVKCIKYKNLLRVDDVLTIHRKHRNS